MQTVALKQTLIFTDLDGTLLDHDNYSFAAAQPVLNKLAAHNIPVIPVTSKTKEEVLQLREALNLETPFVIENGAGIYIPKHYFSYVDESLQDCGHYWCKQFAPSRTFWCEQVNTLSVEFPDCFRSFSRMGTVGIAKATGLSDPEAALANIRDFSEPIHWLGADREKERFITRVEAMGFTVLQGGRFLHLTNGYDKGQALTWLKQQYSRQLGGYQPFAIALGDSGNDIDMLEACDQPILVRSKTNGAMTLTTHVKEIRTRALGPEGWAEALCDYFNFSHETPK
jgi:mannosyl-3-phosphoglycerate phosphatase